MKEKYTELKKAGIDAAGIASANVIVTVTLRVLSPSDHHVRRDSFNANDDDDKQHDGNDSTTATQKVARPCPEYGSQGGSMAFDRKVTAGPRSEQSDRKIAVLCLCWMGV